ncbi:Ig-like domain-containing protein, partial [Candidatus Micrarchaeota archaeon]|nr:Ig-like domain-containing protein [Candidatus Micrarchaeota archaeon]
MGIKDLYYSAEDKYYELIDKIDQHIPIHKIIEPIDNIVPSFMVVIALILIIILGLLFVLLGNGLGPEADLSFKIINEKGEPLSQITIKVSFDENTQALTTNAYGKTTKKIKVPLNSIVTYEIEETGYEKTKNSFKFTEEGEKTITLKLAEKVTPEGTKKTIRLYYEGTNELVTGKTYTVSFSCSNSSATPPATITITNGTGEVTEPADCGLLTATIRGDFTETIEAVLYDSSNAIYLEGLLQKNTLTVSVEDIDGNPLNGIKVNIDAIYENNSNPSFKDSGYTSYYGEAEFELEAGTYKITVFDEEGNYYQKTQTTEFSTDKTISFTLEEVDLTDPETGSLKITVIDADTEIVLPETKVSIYYPEGEVFEEKTTDENGMVIFFVQDNSLLYDAVLDNEQYIVKRVTELSADNQAYTIEMEKYTGNNAGKLKVRAVVIEGERIRPVRNARIALYEVNEFNEETLSGISEKITDANGYAEFTKLKNNTYKAFAYKGTASGWSDALKYDKRLQDEVELTATMIIPDGTINLQVFDQEGNRIPFATVTFYEDGTFQTIKSDKTDNNGSISFVTKADKQINFVVQAPDFLDYYSKTYPVLGNQTIEEKITMIPVTRLKTPEINFIGLFKGNEKVLDETSLESGEEYTVKLQFAVPENKNYEEAGVHFRVGNDIYMENDYLFIKKVNAGKAITTKYIMFDKDNLNDTKKSTTKGDSKWFNSIWLLPKAGVYEIEVLIKVKDNVPLGQELKLRFRGYGKTGGKYDRDPTDVSVTSATELLAETKEKTFTVGTNILCSEEFCFSATILDLKEDIIKNVTNAYPTKILQKYELSFDILNNDKTQKHYNARIQLENSDEMLNFLDYKIKNADALTRTGNANAPETPWIDLGDFDPNTHITGNTQFITQESKPGTIKITIVSNQEIVFEKEIQLEVEAPKLFRMEFEPNPVPSNTSNLVEFTVYDEETGLEVEDAQIKVLDKFRDLIAGPVLTDKIGKATLTIPGQAPDTELIFRIEKQEFEVFEQRIRIDGNIVEITPEQIGITLNTKKLTEDTYPLKIKNLLEYDLELTSLEFTGNFRRLLDERAMNAWIYTNYTNIVIPAGMTKEIQVKAILSSYGIERQERDMVDLELEFEFSNGEAVWTKTIPARISIGIGGEVDDPNCLTVERKEWKTSTEGQKVKIDFGITNSCTIDGKPIELRDLEAKINWTSNHIGTYTLTFEGQDIELRSAYYRMLSSIMQNRKYNATLAFEPLGGVNGDAIAEITVRAKNQLDGKDEFIEDKISTEIKSVNLEDCIKISPIELNIKKGETAVFGIETTGCGSNVSFTLDSEIKTSNTSITLGSQEKGPDIIVDSRDAFPGRYLIKVEAKGISLATKAYIQNVFVTVYDDACIQLSRYEFDIYDDSENEFDGYDTAQLYNYCNERDQDITINMQDWTLSMRKSLLPAVIAFGVTKALKPKTVPDAAGDGSGTGSGGTDGLGTGTTGTSNTGTSSGGTSNGGGSNNNDKDKKDGDGDDKDSDDSEGGGGIIGTVGKGASWVWNNTFGRLFGGGDKDDSDGDDDGGDDDDSGDGGGYVAPKETLPTTAFIPLPIVGELSSMLGLDNLLGSVFGGVNPFVAFGLAFVGATLYNYFSADAMDMQTTVDDITIDNIKLIEGIKYTE